jgi:murein DD-endopeptidase MepM/ murein hydrolase activator NlpD
LSDYAGFRVSAFSDHNPTGGQVLDYNSGTRTYDAHRGTDYALWPFSWNKLDAGEMQVIAAAVGTIAAYANVDPTDHNCSVSSSDPWNYVALVHADGRMTIYGHMRYNSLTSKGVGQTVAQGEYLGTAASSGNSSGPHLHFEVRYGSFSTAEWIDPYAGPNSQPSSLWANQRPYFDSAINKLATHSSPPSTPDPCQPSIPNLQNNFTAPARIYFYAYYRDYQGALATQLKIYRPDGSLYSAWQYAPAGNPFYSAWNQGWVFDLTAGDPAGTWRFEAVYNDQVYETFFTIIPALTARADFALSLMNTPVLIDALSNDSGPNGESLTITALGAPAHGTVSNLNSILKYSPATNFLGTDVFTYTVNTSTESANATVTVQVVAEIHRSFLPLVR